MPILHHATDNYGIGLGVRMGRLDEQYNGNGSGTLEESEQEELARLRREKAAPSSCPSRASSTIAAHSGLTCSLASLLP